MPLLLTFKVKNVDLAVQMFVKSIYLVNLYSLKIVTVG